MVADASGRFSFACRKAFVRIKIRGRSAPFLFHKCDKVTFRIGTEALIIEKGQDFTMKKCLDWAKLESVSAGEPETDNGSLFQG